MPEKPQLYTIWERVPNGTTLARRLGVPTKRLLIRSDAVVAGNVWLEVPIDPHWLAASRLAVQDGHLVVAEVRLFPRETGGRRVPGRWRGVVLGTRAPVPRGGLTARTLRAVRLGEHLKHTHEVLAWFQRKHGKVLFEAGHSLEALGLLPPDQDRPRRARNAGQPDRFYATLATTYVQLVSRGVRHPIRTIARRRHIGSEKVRDWIREARVRGLLTMGTQGRAGGQLTPLARRVLKSPSSRVGV